MKRVTLKKREMSYAMTEELNTLRTNIQFSGVDKKVIVMTSSFSGEGKSTITYQLAKSLAELGKRVLLIDADMRKSVMVNMLESGSVDKGLSHYLSGQCSLSEAVYARVPDFIFYLQVRFRQIRQNCCPENCLKIH